MKWGEGMSSWWISKAHATEDFAEPHGIRMAPVKTEGEGGLVTPRERERGHTGVLLERDELFRNIA